MRVFAVWHVHHATGPHEAPPRGETGQLEFDESEDDLKLIGVYSSQSNAEGAVERTALLGGFAGEPKCFMVNEHTVDEDNWTTGFVSPTG